MGCLLGALGMLGYAIAAIFGVALIAEFFPIILIVASIIIGVSFFEGKNKKK